MRAYIAQLFPKYFFTNPAYFRALGLGFVYLSLALLQLFTFEKFVDVTTEYGVAGGGIVAALLAGLVPLLEVASLPYLMSMRITPRLRRCSMIATLAIAGLWLVIALWLNLTGKWGINTGLMGATIPTVNSWWFVVFAGMQLWAALLVVRELPRRPSH